MALLQEVVRARANNRLDRTIKARAQQLLTLLQNRNIDGANNLALLWL
jgi:hypothetical protein